MNVEKTKLKVAWGSNWGNKLDDMREGIIHECGLAQGASQAFLNSIRSCRSMLSHIDTDIEEGKVPGDLAAAQYAKDYVTRCMKALENLGMQSDHIAKAADGKKAMLEQILNMLKKDVDQDQQKLNSYNEVLAETGGDVEAADLSTRPDVGVSAAEDIENRRAEAKAKKAAAKANKEVTKVDPQKPEVKGRRKKR